METLKVITAVVLMLLLVMVGLGIYTEVIDSAGETIDDSIGSIIDVIDDEDIEEQSCDFRRCVKSIEEKEWI